MWTAPHTIQTGKRMAQTGSESSIGWSGRSKGWSVACVGRDGKTGWQPVPTWGRDTLPRVSIHPYRVPVRRVPRVVCDTHRVGWIVLFPTTVASQVVESWVVVGHGSSSPIASRHSVATMKSKKPLILSGIILAVIALVLFVRASFLNAKATAIKHACQGDLQDMAGWKAIWGIESKKTSNDTPTMEDLVEAKSKLVMHRPYVCGAGGAYTLGRLDQNPTCSFHGNSLPAEYQLNTFNEMKAAHASGQAGASDPK